VLTLFLGSYEVQKTPYEHFADAFLTLQYPQILHGIDSILAYLHLLVEAPFLDYDHIHTYFLSFSSNSTKFYLDLS